MNRTKSESVSNAVPADANITRQTEESGTRVVAKVRHDTVIEICPAGAIDPRCTVDVCG